MPSLPAEDGPSESSSDISSPPLSPPQNPADEISVAPRLSTTGLSALGGGVATSASRAPATNAAASTTNGTTTDAPKKTRKPRAKAEPKDGKNAGDEPVKEKKPRKPREPKVKKEGEAAVKAAPRKRQKTEEKSTPGPADGSTGSRQPTITEMVNQFQAPGAPASAPHQQQPPSHQPIMPYQAPSHPSAPRPQSSTPVDTVMRNSVPPPSSNAPTPRPFSSGQNYDPIRGSTIDSAPPRTTSLGTNGNQSANASPHVNRASASPSIISLIDPPQAAKTSSMAAPTMPYSSQSTTHTSQQQQAPPFVGVQQSSPTPPKAAPVHAAIVSQPTAASMDGAMDIDRPSQELSTKSQQELMKVPSKSSSAAPTPKIGAAKASPPRATGSGLLSSSDLFGGPSAGQSTERKGVDIDIRISLNPNGGNTINMAQEIAKRYGRDAINPRAAAHRERLLQVAAAANKLEGGSADDMSVDLMSELDGDSNVEMGGMDEEKSATGADDPKPRKRRKKVEEYDKEDDFIDDTELAWQEQAAVAKDGFFVYSGPLIPQGQTAQIESTTTRGRGGRGRGRGRGAAAAASGTTHASLAEKKESTGRGRGRGRGTGAPRKPRITKADRERMEAEKQARMKMTDNPSIPGMSGPPVLAPSTSHGESTTGNAHGPTQPHAHQVPPQPTYAHGPGGVRV